MSLASRRRQRGSTKRRGKSPGSLGGLVRRGANVLGGRRGGRVMPRRGRGITKTELRGFNRVSGLLAKWGMVPRKMRGARPPRRRR